MLDGSFNGCAWYNWLLRNRYVYKSGFASKNCYVWNCNISIVCWNCSSQNTGRLRKYHTCFRAVVGCYFNRTRMMPVFVDPAYPAWRHPMANLKKKYFTLPTTYFAPPFSSHRSRVSLFGHDAFVVCVCVCFLTLQLQMHTMQWELHNKRQYTGVRTSIWKASNTTYSHWYWGRRLCTLQTFTKWYSRARIYIPLRARWMSECARAHLRTIVQSQANDHKTNEYTHTHNSPKK